MISDHDTLATLNESVEALKKLIPQETMPELLCVLGSGFKGFDAILSDRSEIPFHAIKHFPIPKVEGHGSSLVIGKVKNKNVAILTGRVHLYEGHTPATAVFALRVLAKLGVKKVLLTNASGSVDTSYKPGNLVLVTDHINLTGQNALIGSLSRHLGPQFPDMSQVYSKSWLQTVNQAFPEMKTGVYAGVLGPSYETPAETKMLGRLGANIVGMSTVQESIAAHHMGVTVLCLSFITNMAGGLGDALSHNDVLQLVTSHQDQLLKTLQQVIQIS